MPIINGSYCYTTNIDLARQASYRAFCAGYENQERGSCTRDSGGGFYIKDTKQFFWAVHGIISSSLWDEKFSCDVNKFAIYTNVGIFRDWIDKVMQRTGKVKWEVVEVQCVELNSR